MRLTVNKRKQLARWRTDTGTRFIIEILFVLLLLFILWYFVLQTPAY